MIAIIVGTRPEIIKLAPIIKIFETKGKEYELIHTHQHYDRSLSEIFFNELMLPKPDCYLDVGSGTHAQQTGTALIRIEKRLLETKPRLVLVEGDTNTVLAAALAATKLNIPVAHVEAGLRSYDLRMPEEHNRRLTDHLSSYLFAPTEQSKKILCGENVCGRVYVTGNTVIDTCRQYMPIAKRKSKILNEINFSAFALATAHRTENVDNPTVLKNFVEIFTKCPLPVVYPIHHRTVEMLKKNNLYKKLASSKNIQLLPPIGYFDFLLLLKNCTFVLSDSGGIQEEVTAPNIRKKVFVLRKSTERPEAVAAGFAEVVGVNAKTVLKRINQKSAWFLPSKKVQSPYGDGNASKRICEVIFAVE